MSIKVKPLLRPHSILNCFICLDADKLEDSLLQKDWSTQQRQNTNEQWRLRRNTVTLILYMDGRLLVDSHDQTAATNRYRQLLTWYGPTLQPLAEQEEMEL